MKKNTSLIFIIFVIILSGCSHFENTNAALIDYQGKDFAYNASEDYRFDSVWYPLSEADMEDTGYLHFDNKKYTNKDEISIRLFSDTSLDMFLVYHALGEDNLYGSVDFVFPDYVHLDELEEIVIRQDYQGDWKDAYNSGKVTIISDEERLNHFKNSMNKIYGNSMDVQSPLPEDTKVVGNEVGLKFKGMNAIYYLGMLAHKDGNEYYFYNANTEGNELYLITI